MFEKNKAYKAIVSSDWNQCLAPCGPFDFISFSYPQLTNELENLFKQYTGNIISLGKAVNQVQKLLPSPITEEQMDLYLNESFVTYRGVPELIEWCNSRNILFMINTTGMIGYFQRVFEKNLLPEVQVLSAHPMVRFPKCDTDPPQIYDLLETTDKAKNTESAGRSLNIPSNKIIIMGDSGGDGPHFKWGFASKALLIANMIKPSLQKYCEEKNIPINAKFGPSYENGKAKDFRKEMQTDFMDLAPIIEDFVNR